MYNFKDNYFSNEYNRYCELRNKGLKKQSNKVLEELMLYFDGLNEDTKKEICTEFCVLRFEKNKIEDFNFFLSKRILEFLEHACIQNQMPHLRWYYQLTNDRERLKKAYQHIECDEKTVYFTFDCLMSDLYWGAHHFPKCCLFEETVIHRLLVESQNFIEKHTVSKEQKEEYLYYKALYNDWWTYQSGNFDCSFDEWCINQNRDYKWLITVYYKSK